MPANIDFLKFGDWMANSLPFMDFRRIYAGRRTPAEHAKFGLHIALTSVGIGLARGVPV
jgi:hypothetical protein